MRLIFRSVFIVVILAGVLTLYIGTRPEFLVSLHDSVQEEASGNTGTAEPADPVTTDLQALREAVSDNVSRVSSLTLVSSRTAPDTVSAIDASDIHPVQAGQLSCIETPTSTPTSRQQAGVYQWEDEEGRTYFGDRPPENSGAKLINTEQTRQVDYFSLEIDYGGGAQVPFLHDRLRVSAEQIFSVLADMIGEERLRTVELKLTVLPDRAAFLAHGGQYLDANIDAYYSPVTNESVTWQHDDPDYTLVVARHESVHVILAGLLGGGVTPNWLNEGLAKYFELMEPRSRYNHVPVDWMSARATRLLTEQYGRVSLKDFMDADSDAWMQNLQVNYPFSASLVFYLMDSPENRRVLGGLLQRMADNYCQGADVTAYLEEQIPGGLSALENGFYRWLEDVDGSMYHRH